MEVEIQVPPQLDEIPGLRHVTVGRWLAAVGETVLEGASVVELETDLVILELPAPVSGKLTRILKKTGQRVGLSETLAFMLPG